MLKACFFLSLLLLCSVSTGGQATLPGKRYFCASHLRNGERASQYFDRLLLITKSLDREGFYTAKFPLHIDPPFEMRQNGDFLFGYFQTFAGKRKKNELYREEYNIYRLNTKTNVLIQSHVKYASQQYYEQFKADTAGNPYSAPLSSKPLQFINKELPKDFVKFGWDGSRYICKKVSYPKYLLYSISIAFMQIFGA